MNKSLTEFMAGVLAFIIALVVGLLPAYVVLDVARLYAVPAISDLTFAQTYAACAVFQFILNPKKKKDEKEGETFTEQMLTAALAIVIYSLLWWGLMYLVNLVIA